MVWSGDNGTVCNPCFQLVTLALPKLTNNRDEYASTISSSSAILTQKGESGFRSG